MECFIFDFFFKEAFLHKSGEKAPLIGKRRRQLNTQEKEEERHTSALPRRRLHVCEKKDPKKVLARFVN